MTATVIFRACAPTQSWGAVGNTATDNRPTATHPLQSSVTGLICAALGIDRDNTDGIALIAQAQMAFRIDRQGLITSDYQAINNTITSEGKPRGTILSWRGELQDACITVFCSWPDGHLARSVRQGLRTPRWPLRLGRRCHLVGSFPEAALIEAPLDDALMGAWEPCRIHPPTGQEWTVVADTTEPINAEGVTLTGSAATDFRRRNHTVAPVQTRRIPRTEPPTPADPAPPVTVDATGVVLVGLEELG